MTQRCHSRIYGIYQRFVLFFFFSLFFHNFHIFSLFNLSFFYIVHIFSQFDLLFFHIFHIFSLFDLPFFHIFPIFSLFDLLFFYIVHILSLFDLPIKRCIKKIGNTIQLNPLVCLKKTKVIILEKKEVLFHTFNLERIFFSWNKLRNSIYASFIFLYLFFYFCEGYTTKSSNIRMCIQGQNELFCLLFYFCYIFIDLLTFYSLIVRFCNIFS